MIASSLSGIYKEYLEQSKQHIMYKALCNISQSLCQLIFKRAHICSQILFIFDHVTTYCCLEYKRIAGSSENL